MLRDDVPFEMQDFGPIGNIQLDAVVLAVPADSPYQTFAEFAEAAKADPGGLTVGGDGPQSNNQLHLVVTSMTLCPCANEDRERPAPYDPVPSMPNARTCP